MNSPEHRMPGRQQGAVLIISMLMLVAISIIAVSSIEDTTLNLRIVGNTQFQQSAKAAAQAAIEKVIATPSVFTTETPDDISETLHGWNVTVRSRYLGCPCGNATNEGQSLSAQQQFKLKFSVDTACWDVAASVADPATGTSLVVHQGFERKQRCPGT